MRGVVPWRAWDEESGDREGECEGSGAMAGRCEESRVMVSWVKGRGGIAICRKGSNTMAGCLCDDLPTTVPTWLYGRPPLHQPILLTAAQQSGDSQTPPPHPTPSSTPPTCHNSPASTSCPPPHGPRYWDPHSCSTCRWSCPPSSPRDPQRNRPRESRHQTGKCQWRRQCRPVPRGGGMSGASRRCCSRGWWRGPSWGRR